MPEGTEIWELRLTWPHLYPQVSDLGPRDSGTTEISYLGSETD